MNKMLLFLCSFFVLTVFSQEKEMSSTEIEHLQIRVKKTAKTTKTVQSDFIQKKHLSFLSNDITTYGKLAFKTPNLVKWEYTKPYKYSVIFKNNTLLVNDDGKKNKINIGSSNLFKRMNQLIVKSINGDMFDTSEFDILYYQSANFYKVKFTTKNGNFKKFINRFELLFNKKTYEVMQVKMIEPSDDYTKIIFKNRKQNLIIKNEVFTN